MLYDGMAVCQSDGRSHIRQRSDMGTWNGIQQSLQYSILVNFEVLKWLPVTVDDFLHRSYIFKFLKFIGVPSHDFRQYFRPIVFFVHAYSFSLTDFCCGLISALFACNNR